MKTAKISAILVVSIYLIPCPVSKAEPLGTTITYEGILANDDGPAEGFYDFAFALYDAVDPNTRTQIGSAIRMNEFNVVNGLFQAELDFGNGDPNVFNSDARWLETIAWPSGSDATESNVLYLFQEIKPVPYSLLSRGIFVDKDRNVGIGTSSPAEKLHVAGRAQFDLGSGRINMSTPGGWPGIIGFSPNGHRRDVIIDDVGIRLLTSDSSSAAPGQNGITIREDGNVGIGTAAPGSYKLAVNGSAAKVGGGTWSTFSDIRLKEVGTEFRRGLSEVAALKPVWFSYSEDNKLGLPAKKEFIGVIAQDVQGVIPEAVEENESGYLMVNNDPIIWAMVNAIKELKEENEILKQRIEALENKQSQLIK
ncbi:MAG: tail fiber domain-containing protein [Sedimentisphaerales bacterium]|nr:tail fiber domain-containing protein [Sedimentisphaerales bacterium]